MSENKTNETNGAVAQQAEEDQIIQGLPVTVHAQYLRDLSFENPNTPQSLRAGLEPPQMDVNIGMDARKIEDEEIKNLYEVVINVRAEARREDSPVFLVELQFGLTVSIGESVPEENHHPLLFIEIPRIGFPYARQIMSDLTMQGGYPPLMLNPVDFHALYMERFSKEIEESRKQAE